MSRHRVVITGIGAICGLGRNRDEIWQAMRAGRSAIGEITTAELHDLKCRIGAEIRDLPDIGLQHRQMVTMDRFSHLAVIAAGEALAQSGIVIDEESAPKVGTVVGTGVFGGNSLEESYRAIFIEGKKRTNVFTVPRVMPGAPAGQVSMIHGLRGPVFGVTSACASSNHAIGAAADMIRLGRADVMVGAGTEAPLAYGVLKAWEALRVLAPSACRPFSADREGLVLGEGAAAIVLESLEHAEARGATILAELAGSGMTADAADIVAPNVDGPTAAIRACLADADLSAEDVDYINAHGTATRVNDKVESAAIHAVFGDRAKTIAVSSTKSMHAHCLGASGALEALACVMAIRDNLVPPTAGFNERDPECDLDVTPNEAREREINVA
ncbi:MAG TPA: beta-ketoacyl-[acyl-carrier-protein] synthase family protein, partial [Pararhizobium sp.]|nr:beta-ketoacyl-[acyl-carrier-protein] synthase family protein [Pararhizobium sp.]